MPYQLHWALLLLPADELLELITEELLLAGVLEELTLDDATLEELEFTLPFKPKKRIASVALTGKLCPVP